MNWKNLKTRDYSGHKKKVHSVAWSVNGEKLASGSVDQTARIWNIEQNSKEIDLRGHIDSVDQVGWDPNKHDILASASVDKTVRIWDTRTGKATHTINTKGENINMSWSPDSKYIAVGNKEDDLSIIDTSTGKIMKTINFNFEVNEISWNTTGDLFFLTTGPGTIDIMEPYPSERSITSLQAHTANIYCIDFDPTGKYFAVGSADALVSLWNCEDMICERTFSRLDWPVRAISFSFDGRYIASASEDEIIDIGEVESGEQVYAIPCDAPMNSISWHPSQHLLAFAGDDKDKNGYDSGVIRVFGFK